MLSLLLQAGALATFPTHASWHAPDALVFVEVPDVPRMLIAYEQAPWLQMLRDEELNTAFEAVVSEIGLDLDGAFNTLLTELGLGSETPFVWPDDALARLRRVRAASLSFTIAEESPGEAARTFQQVLEARAEIEQLLDALEDFQHSHPDATSVRIEDLEVPEGSRTDPWDHAYRLELAREASSAMVRSLGADDAAGGEGAAADLDSSFDLAAWTASEYQRRAGLTCIVEFTEELHAQQALEAWASISTTVATADSAPSAAIKRKGVLRNFTLDPRPALAGWTFQSAGRVVLGLGAVEFESVLQRVERAAPALSSSLQRLETHAGAATGATVVRGSIDSTSLKGPLESLLTQPTSATLAPLTGLSALIGSTAFRMQLAGQRFTTDLVNRNASDPHGWTHAFGSTPVPANFARWVPEDAIAALLTTLDGQRLHAQLIELMSFDESDPARSAEQLAQLEARHDFNLKRDVFDALGSGCAAYLLPIASFTSLPGAALVLELRDAAAFERGINGLSAALREQSGGAVQIKSKKYKDAPMWTFSFDQGDDTGGMNPFAVTPTLSIVQGHAIVTLNSVRATKEIKRALDEAGAPHALSKLERPAPAQATTIGYMDWGALFNGAYTSGRGALSLVGGALEMPFDVNVIATALPDGNAITRFFQPTVLWSRAIEGGSHTHWESSFGPETWTSVLVFGVQVGFGVRELFEQPTANLEAPELDGSSASTAALEATRATLDVLATRLAVFQLDQGRWPGALDELTQPTPNYPDGFLDSGSVPADGWERAFVYSLASDGASYRLWSLGPDGLDASGSGDDLVVP